MARQISPAAVDAVPGSYHVTGSYPAYTLYVHTSDDSDPSANGSVYEVSTRLHGIDCPVGVSGCTVNGIACEKPAHIDGAIVLRGRRQAIRNAAARHGSKHNWLIGSGRSFSR